MTDRADQSVRRIVEANWASFDSPLPSPGAAQRHLIEVEATLAEVRADAATLRKRLHALETSTSWRLTGPLRHVLERLRPPPPPRPAPPPPVPPGPKPPLTYERWIQDCEAASQAELSAVQPGRRGMTAPSLGLVLLPGPGSAAALEQLAADCPARCQILGLMLPGDPAAPSAPGVRTETVAPGFTPAQAVAIALRMLAADLVCFLDPRDRLAAGALALAAEFAARRPHADVIFADEDWLDQGRRVHPFLKPGWDRELHRGRDLLGPFTFFRTTLLRQAAPQDGPAWLFDLGNQVAAAARPEHIVHIPAVLSHRVAPPPTVEAVCQAATAQLRRDGIAARVAATGQGGCRVIYDLPASPPLVSVIVPTRDHAELLEVCADALLNRTDYDRLEILIVDNGSAEPAALALLDRLASAARVRLLRRPGPFNWSAINNRAARDATGDVLVLLNNDIDALHPDWLSILVAHVLQPGVGAVGPKLLYPDGTVQHAGLTTSLAGVPRHLYRFAPGDAPGAFGLLADAREVWGVTGACLAVRRDVFLGLGGLNEALPVAYNDVDLCLNLTARGYRIVWTPWAVLEHRELASRPADHLAVRRDQAREELDRLLRDWGRLAIHDPFLNPNLHLEEEHPCFRRPPDRADALAG